MTSEKKRKKIGESAIYLIHFKNIKSSDPRLEMPPGTGSDPSLNKAEIWLSRDEPLKSQCRVSGVVRRDNALGYNCSIECLVTSDLTVFFL